MIYLTISTVFGLCFFIVPLLAYRQGIKDGMRVAQGKPPEPLKGPIQAIKDKKMAEETKREQDRLVESINNLLSYDGTPQKGSDT